MLKELYEKIGDNVTLNLTIKFKNGKATMLVGFNPDVNDTAFNLPPINVCNTPEEAEKEFLEFLSNPKVQKVTESIQNVVAFEEAAEEASKKNKAAKAEKEEKKKEKSKIEELVDKGNKFITTKDLEAAEKIDAKLSDLKGVADNAKYKKFLKDLKALQSELSTPNLFADDKKDDKLDADITAKGSESRAIEYGGGASDFDLDTIETIKQERIDKLNQNGNTELTEDF